MIHRSFWRNVLPSMVAFAFSGVYAIVDGIFVGRSVGDLGLAAVGIAYPLCALLQALGTGLGMSGAVVLSVCIGRRETEQERRALGNTAVLLLLAGALAMALLSLLYRPVLVLMGASGQILDYACAYTRVVALGAIFQVLGTGLVPLLRTYDGATPAMLAMAAGFTCNVLLDWLLISVWDGGTAGAAAATVIAQALTAALCLVFLGVKNVLRRARPQLTHDRVRRLLRTALSPFGLTLVPNLTMVILNREALAHGGNLAVACYAVINYSICIAQLLLQGIGDGAQPLLSRSYGADDRDTLRLLRRLTFRTAPAAALACCAALFLARGAVPILFGASQDSARMFVQVLPLFLLSLPALSLARSCTSFFYATEQPARACLLIYGEPLLLLLFAWLLPLGLELNGVWLSVPATQMVLAAVGLVLLRLPRREGRPLSSPA